MDSVKGQIKLLIPVAARLGLLVLRRAPLWRKAGIIFIHVPKNGGTSINKALYGRFMGHCRVSDIERVHPNLMGELPSFAIVRNPWARTFSAWNFARRGAEMQDGARIGKPERYTGEDFISFEHFVLRWLPQRNLSKEDFVFRPQSQFLVGRSGSIGVTHVGQIEDKTSYIPFVEDVLCRRIQIGHLNSTSDPERYRDAYSREMRDMVARLYAEDVERFNYDF